jgi:hypothetical protein
MWPTEYTNTMTVRRAAHRHRPSARCPQPVAGAASPRPATRTGRRCSGSPRPHVRHARRQGCAARRPAPQPSESCIDITAARRRDETTRAQIQRLRKKIWCPRARIWQDPRRNRLPETGELPWPPPNRAQGRRKREGGEGWRGPAATFLADAQALRRPLGRWWGGEAASVRAGSAAGRGRPSCPLEERGGPK